MVLSQEQVRVLGCLLEKERTTPEDYPLTANALMRAANQSTSRDPVVSYDVGLVERVLVELKDAGLVRFVHSPSNRATKYRHVLDDAWSIDRLAGSLLSLLMLRGPQTTGELRGRLDRLGPASAEEVAAALDDLGSRPEPLVALGERRPGQKEARWSQQVGEAAAPSDAGDGPAAVTGSTPAPGSAAGLAVRVAALEADVDSLRASLAELRELLGLEPEIPTSLSEGDDTVAAEPD